MSTPKTFRKKPVEIEAVRWDGTVEGSIPVLNWMLDAGGVASYCYRQDTTRSDTGSGESIAIDTIEGRMHASAGDWIIRGVQGEFYPCKPDIFAESYGEVIE